MVGLNKMQISSAEPHRSINEVNGWFSWWAVALPKSQRQGNVYLIGRALKTFFDASARRRHVRGGMCCSTPLIGGVTS